MLQPHSLKQKPLSSLMGQIQAEKARRSLLEFVRQAWNVLEPEAVFVGGWHLEAMCEHLEACSNGEISKLIIAIPPGHMKSLLCCVFWPAWEWISKPYLRQLFSAYSSKLSIRDSIKMRTLIQSEWYQHNFGNRYKLDKTNENHLTTDKFGFRIATSLDGVGTGQRIHRLVVDDLLNATDSRSDAMQERAHNFMRSMASRGVPGFHYAQVIIGQRLSEKDPTQWALDQLDWEKFILPAEFESHRRAVTCLGWKDPRTEEKELLWPALYDEKKIEELKRALGPQDAAAQLQQLPAPAEGGIVKAEWFDNKYYKELPKIAYFIQSWDTAFKTKQENDYSVCTTWGVATSGDYYLVDRYKAKVEFPELKNVMFALWRKYKPLTILVEDKASGQSLVQEMSRPLDDIENPGNKVRLPIKPVQVENDKASRLHACTTLLQLQTWLPHETIAHWVKDYLYTLLVFPNGAHDDDVDSTTQALIFLAANRPRTIKNTNLNIMGR